MITLQLDMYQACALGALVYCLGRLMVNKLSFLSKYCIPAPVAGGIVFALAHLALYAAGILELSFDTTLQSVFMTIFFCSVGFTACFRLFQEAVRRNRMFRVLLLTAWNPYINRAAGLNQRLLRVRCRLRPG